MNAKYLVAGTLVGGIFLFLWGGALHTGVPLEVQGLRELTDGGPVVQALLAQTRGNGVYFSPQGLMVVVAFRPGRNDVTESIGSNLALEFAANLAQAFLLSLLTLQLRGASAAARAGGIALAAVAAGLENQVSDWNWYGFSTAFTVFELVDVIAGWLVLGLILGALAKKLAPQS